MSENNVAVDKKELKHRRACIWPDVLYVIERNSVIQSNLDELVQIKAFKPRILLYYSLLLCCFSILSILLKGAFSQVAEFNDSCLPDIVFYSKESLGSYPATKSRKDNIEGQNKRYA